MTFSTLADFATVLSGFPPPDAVALAGAEARNGQLTKPPGALGRMEDLAIWIAVWQGTARPRIEQPQVLIFAGNHGVTAQGISAFPAEVTAQMVANFKAGGAALNQLSRAFGCDMAVYPLECLRPTADFTGDPAMHFGSAFRRRAWPATPSSSRTRQQAMRSEGFHQIVRNSGADTRSISVVGDEIPHSSG